MDDRLVCDAGSGGGIGRLDGPLGLDTRGNLALHSRQAEETDAREDRKVARQCGKEGLGVCVLCVVRGWILVVMDVVCHGRGRLVSPRPLAYDCAIAS